MNTHTFIEIAKLTEVSGWLIFMAIIDIQNHRIPDKYFKWFFTMSFGFILYNLTDPIPVLVSFVLTVLYIVILRNIPRVNGGGAGGADVKLFALLSVLYPIPIHSFPFALLVFGVAGVGVGVYGFIKASSNGQTVRDVVAMKLPFIPFVLLGYLVVVITAL